MKIIYVHCGPEFFFRSYFNYYFSSVHGCEDRLYSFLHRKLLARKETEWNICNFAFFFRWCFLYWILSWILYVIHTRQNACLKTSATTILFPLSSKPPASTNSSNVRPFYTKRSEWDQKLTLNNHERAFECIYLLKKVVRLHVRASTVKLLGRRYAATLVDRATGHFP